MKYIASVSFGKDSLAMLLRLIEEKWPLDIVVFYDTGMEFEAIYKIRDKVKELLTDQGIGYVELKPEKPFLFSMLDKKVVSKQKGTHYGYGWCGGLCRWGTTEKLKAIRNYKKSLHDSVVDYVGIAADEANRINKAVSDGKTLPLVEWGMSESDCLRYCRDKGWNWIEHAVGDSIDLYDILDRVSCWCCCNKNLKELKNIYLYLPDYWNKLKNLQQRIDRPFKGYYKGEPRGIVQLEQRFKKECEYDSI